jgi:hypothetical protein
MRESTASVVDFAIGTAALLILACAVVGVITVTGHLRMWWWRRQFRKGRF